MAYPHIVSLIDMQLARLQRARFLLDESSPASIVKQSQPVAPTFSADALPVTEPAPVQVTIVKPAGPPRERRRHFPAPQRMITALQSRIPEKPVFAPQDQLRREAQMLEVPEAEQPLTPEMLTTRWLRKQLPTRTDT